MRVIAELLRPFMPGTGERMLEMVGVAPSPQSWVGLRSGALAPGTRLGETHALFPRIEQSVEELRTMASDPSQPAPPSEPRHQPHHRASSSGDRLPHPRRRPRPPSPRGSRIDDFMKVELRVAKVLAAERVPKSNKLLKLQVDVGTEQRTLVAGIAEAYEPEALVGRTVVIVFNLKPAKLMGIESNGMVLAASPDGGKPMLVSFEEPPPTGNEGPVGERSRRSLIVAAAIAGVCGGRSRVAPAGAARDAARGGDGAAVRGDPQSAARCSRRSCARCPRAATCTTTCRASIYAESYLRWAAEDNLCVATATFALVAGTCDAAAGRPPPRRCSRNAALYNAPSTRCRCATGRPTSTATIISSRRSTKFDPRRPAAWGTCWPR